MCLLVSQVVCSGSGCVSYGGVFGFLVQVCLRALGLLSVSVGLLVALTCLTAGGVAVWYVPFRFLQTWNCIVMRNQEVVEQPLVMETLAERMLNEAQHFISR